MRTSVNLVSAGKNLAEIDLAMSNVAALCRPFNHAEASVQSEQGNVKLRPINLLLLSPISPQGGQPEINVRCNSPTHAVLRFLKSVAPPHRLWKSEKKQSFIPLPILVRQSVLLFFYSSTHTFRVPVPNTHLTQWLHSMKD